MNKVIFPFVEEWLTEENRSVRKWEDYLKSRSHKDLVLAVEAMIPKSQGLRPYAPFLKNLMIVMLPITILGVDANIAENGWNPDDCQWQYFLVAAQCVRKCFEWLREFDREFLGGRLKREADKCTVLE